jgi:hypothetical protein
MSPKDRAKKVVGGAFDVPLTVSPMDVSVEVTLNA